jgi:hypothetical protein
MIKQLDGLKFNSDSDSSSCEEIQGIEIQKNMRKIAQAQS